MTLIQLFTSIANAIRAKKGTSETIYAEDFPNEIAGITTGHLDNTEYTEANDDLDDILENTTVPSGTITITQNGIVDVTNYVEANVNVVSENNAKIGPININNYASILAKITEIASFDVMGATLLNECFMNCHALVKSPQLLNIENVGSIEKLFYGCESLVDVCVYNFPNVTNPYNAFKSCSSLSNESLNNIMAICIGMTRANSAYKSLNKIGLTSAQATTCQSLSNYQAFLDAGWTTGY